MPLKPDSASTPSNAADRTATGSAFQQSSASSAGAGAQHGAAAGPASNLSSVTTGKGPLVLGSVEEGAQAQQVLQVLDNYDFRWGGGTDLPPNGCWQPLPNLC